MDNKKKNGMRSRYDEDMDWLDDDDDYLDDGGLIGSLLFGDKKKKEKRRDPEPERKADKRPEKKPEKKTQKNTSGTGTHIQDFRIFFFPEKLQSLFHQNFRILTRNQYMFID